MKKLTSLFIALLGFFICFSANAATCYSATGTYNGTEATRVTVGPLPSPQAVCDALAAGIGAYDYRSPWTGSYNGSCAMYGNAGQSLGNYGNFSTQECVNPDTCGLAPGTKIKQNFSEGWARSSDINKIDYVGKVNLPFFVGGGEDGTQLATHCIDKCKARATKVLDRYRAKTPSPNGFYRLSGDYEFDVIGTSASGAKGDTCSTANNTQAFNDAVSPTTPPLPCPGSVGEVNGKTVCIPGNTASSSIPPPSGEPPPGTEQSGNPRAGDIPTSGEGSGTGGAGRTPSAGNGTAAGGPSGAASSGGGSTGTTPKPAEGEEQQACGAPGQPPCKIDETGTPTDGNFSDGEQRLEQAKTDAIAEINKARTGQGFTWTFQLPTGCQPLQLPAFAGMIDSIDICQFQPTIHDLLSMIWIAATIFALWGMASRAFASE